MSLGLVSFNSPAIVSVPEDWSGIASTQLVVQQLLDSQRHQLSLR